MPSLHRGSRAVRISGPGKAVPWRRETNRLRREKFYAPDVRKHVSSSVRTEADLSGTKFLQFRAGWHCKMLENSIDLSKTQSH
jgi:hypothetical protein